MSKLLQAIRYANQKHKGQYRKKNGRPFITHPLEVMCLIANDDKYGGEETAAIIAVLHDVVEDCSGNDHDVSRNDLYVEIKEMFGAVVVSGVRDLTNEFTHLRHPDINRADRKTKEVQRLRGIPHRSMTIKLYDRLVNIQDTVQSKDWNITYAIESWLLASEVADADTYHIAVKILRLAAQIVEKAKK